MTRDTFKAKGQPSTTAQGGGEVVAWKDSEGMLWSSMDEVPGQYLPPVRAFAPLYTAPSCAPVGPMADDARVPDDYRNQASGYRAGWNDALACRPSVPVGVEAADIADRLRNIASIMRGFGGTERIDGKAWERVTELADRVDSLAQQPAAVDGAMSHADLCRLSRVFNAHNVPGLDQDRRINEWLGKRIAAALAQPQGGA